MSSGVAMCSRHEGLSADSCQAVCLSYVDTPTRRIDCFDFESSTERGWAKIDIRAMGDEHRSNDGSSFGRKEFTTSVEFDRMDQGWRIVEE